MGIVRHIAAFIIAALALSACDAPWQGAERDWPPPSPAIWQVTADNGATGWLFGTVHALPAGLRWRTETLDEALSRSDLLVVEIAELDDAATARAAFSAASHTPALPPLSRRVDETDRPALLAAFDQTGLDEDDFAGVESWAAALMLGSAGREHSPANGVDRALIAERQSVVGLETYTAQYELFDRLSEPAQARLLAEVVEDLESGTQDARIEAWLTGDLDQLEKLSSGGILAVPELREALLVSRNRIWTERVAELVESGRRPFVAVGAGHMLGPEGVPALLAAQGFAVERLQ